MEEVKNFNDYFIVMTNHDTFVIRIYDKDRLNNRSDEEVIEDYMEDNYYGQDYEVIDKNTKYDIVNIY